MTVEDFLAAIVADLTRQLPELRECREHEGRFDLNEMKRLTVNSPAVLVSCLGFTRLGGARTGTVEIELAMAAFVACAGGKSRDRAKASAALSQAVVTRVHDQLWGFSQGVRPPANIRGENLYSQEIDKAGVALWAITWRQSIFVQP
ncbi:MAG: hypothetical protein AB7E55_00965 [Pigmentiphaga sp.]